MTELAALALRLGKLPSEVEAEDPVVVDEMVRLLHEADRETVPGNEGEKANALAARMAGR